MDKYTCAICHRKDGLQLPKGKTLLTALLVMVAAGSPLFAQVNQGEKAVTFRGAQTAAPVPLAAQPPTQQIVKRHLPTMDFYEYGQLKAAADASVSTFAAKPLSGAGAGAASTSILNFDFAGSDRFSSADSGFIFTPPDVNSAAGDLGQIAEVTNSHFTCFDSFGTTLRDQPMSDFFNYHTKLLTDPRVVYDHLWNRWVVTEVGFSESPTVQYMVLAVSTTDDCTSPFYNYYVNQPIVAGDFYDYPQLGYDQDALILTFNVFNGAFKYAEVDMIAKAAVYNGRGFSMPYFNGFGGTLTPNIVRDSNGTSVVIRNVIGTANVQLIKLVNTSRSNPSFTGPFNVATPSVCNVPPSASQPGTAAKLDTLDSRFQAPGMQIGSSLYQVQTCGSGAFPIPRVLQINTATNTTIRQDFVYSSGSSHDFNPSLAGNDFGDVLMNWSFTDPLSGTNASVAFSSKLAGANFGPMGTCDSSLTFYNGGRWGDTSGASLDPTDPTQKSFLISNERILNASDWGTHVCSITVAP